jgi:hypothetical protein
MKQRLGKNIEPNAHLYPVQIFDDLIEEDNKWSQIKSRVRLDESLNEGQQKQLWDFLKEFQEVFAWHKGELGQCSVGEHTIDTQGLPPCHMTPGRLSFWEEVEVNRQIQALVNLGKMRKNASKYVYKITLSMKKDGSRRFYGNYRPLNHQTRWDSFPMPLIEDVLNQLGHSEWFSALNL